MKKLNYTSPDAALVEVTSADIIAASRVLLDDNGVIELRSYGFGETGYEMN